ncbi:MAG: hypothetical protein Q9215_000113 [Flavoplaca cf. flavocitrina]
MFDNEQVQPGCYNPPAIPDNLTTRPQRWRDAPSLPPLVTRQSGKAWPGWQNVQYMFTFTSGDSYTSTAFNIRGPQPSRENPLGNPPYPGATSANGPNYVDFLTTTYNQSFIRTFNFGYGGATIDPSLIASPYGSIVQSFQQQVREEFVPTYATNSGLYTAGARNFLFMNVPPIDRSPGTLGRDKATQQDQAGYIGK